jgi:menaquinol-cytochrome c reductase iron-sulfur subunit
MTEFKDTPQEVGRRSFLVRAIVAIQATMGATVAFVFGGATLAPSFERREGTWLRAASSADLMSGGEPVAVTLRVTRQDGFTQVVDRTLVYLVRDGDQVRALSSTCTHLGCRTSYDHASRRILCPCHGGVYDARGNVLEGPPPSPLPALATRIEDGDVFVQVS